MCIKQSEVNDFLMADIYFLFLEDSIEYNETGSTNML